jgi:tRNA threonylcarbamoyladenosine biosynthesis protein TsaB
VGSGGIVFLRKKNETGLSRMLILGIDANSFAGSVALLENSKLLAEVNMDSFLTHSERLLPSVDLVLGTKKLKIRDIDGFALAVGPGSFTGIRIGMSTVKSLALAAEKPVAPVSNLAALAYKLRQPQGRLLCPLLDARKSEVYGGLFKFDGKKLVEVIAQGVYFPDSFFSKLPDNRVIHFIGTGVEKYKKKIFQYFKDKARFPLRSFFIAYEVGLLGYEHLKTGGGKDFRELEPLYFRKSQAEEKHHKG